MIVFYTKQMTNLKNIIQVLDFSNNIRNYIQKQMSCFTNQLYIAHFRVRLLCAFEKLNATIADAPFHLLQRPVQEIVELFGSVTLKLAISL